LDGRQNWVTIMTTDGQYVSSFLVEDSTGARADGEDRLYLAKWAAVKAPEAVRGLPGDPHVTSIFRTDVAGRPRPLLTSSASPS
jgi:hypothetical protein